ncbi:M14 family metallopeptidase [Polaribacter pectinis]|uniref:M14 family metallopeptidase n=1 Tax=Polaribacter pectinis TaxID=2738844 RepID=A0A7G9L6A8_9FLAO|nr:M14 family metallopeptidase [Polaribacter pectinis]QNM84157.1 M14 family metallopeptidase [Polaribacter pectinis]
MKKIVVIALSLLVFSCKESSKEVKDFTTIFEKTKGTETPVYEDIINYYKEISEEYSEISLFSFGQTDAGEPLHLVVYNQEGIFNVDEIKQSTKNRILINNGIHPGESDGIDASMMLLRDIVQNDSLKERYKNSIITIIPVYNVGGSMNRNSYSRANQNGPKAYGFRGNARNFDLNRDFIKQDTKNAATFAEIFHVVNPDVFIDNHVSNGADYQYAITHLFTQHNKLGGSLGTFLENEMRPQIEASLQEKGIAITPYVNVWGNTPEAGFSQFFDSPRYSTGYTTLFHTLGLMVETHMLKPYKIRVEQTYELLFSALDFAEENSETIKKLREKATAEILSKKTYPIAFKVDVENPTELQFKGYEAEYIDSKVTSGKRLFYDTLKPFTKPVKYYNNFVATKEVEIPKAYILQQGWHKIVERLNHNNIEYSLLEKDTSITVEVNHIDAFETRKSAYEGHYLHYNTIVLKSTETLTFRKGDLYIDTNQNGVRYLLETLEAEATDSFFNWNFFDTILQQKEGYSAYVFEDIAEKILAENPNVKSAFEEKLKSDEDFAKNPRMQLHFIYKNSPHYEKAHLLLPVFKVF